jgi:uncharacterized repeat protein (TIGR02543 family)
MRGKLTGRLMAVVLTAAMVFTSVPAAVYAEGQNTAQTEENEVTTEVSGTSASTAEPAETAGTGTALAAGDVAATSQTSSGTSSEAAADATTEADTGASEEAATEADTAASEEATAEAGSAATADGANTSSSVSASSKEASAYTITYEANTEDEVTDLPQETTASADAVLVEQIPTRSGYVFSGWNTAADGSGTVYQPGDTISLSENVTLFAQWELEKVTADTATSGKCGDNLTWNYDADTKTLTISGTGAMYDYAVKEYVDANNTTKYVTTAPWEMAYSNSSIVLDISSGVTNIGACAFHGCGGLTGSLSIPDSVIDIGNSAFSDSGFTGGLKIPDSVTDIGDFAFSDSGFTGGLKIPDSVTKIGYSAFDSCTHFTGNLAIPDSVTEIGESAFNNCMGFNGTLTISKNISKIERRTFYNCNNLTGSLVIPHNVIRVDDEAFFNCRHFSGNLYISDNLQYIGRGAFEECTELSGDLTFNDNVLYIGDYAFCCCRGFTGKLTLPNEIIAINAEAFAGCQFTGELKLPSSVTSIHVRAFEGCSGFTGSLNIPKGVTEISGSAFADRSGFTGELVLPNSVITIGDYAFDNCMGLTGKLVIPESVTSIGDSTFKNCSGLTGDLKIPDSVTDLGCYAFFGCSGFDGHLIISDSISELKYGTFANCSGFTGELKLPTSITSIGGKGYVKEGEGEFEGCKGFTGTLSIPSSVKEIGCRAFYGCSGFNGNLKLDENLSVISDWAFWGCKGFEGNLYIPDSVSSIGSDAFAYCSGFNKKLTLSNNLSEIKESTFIGCSGFTEDLVIPNSVETIGNYAFSDCSGFNGKLIFSDSVTDIGVEAFKGCSGFTGDLKIPDSVVNIGYSVFSGCSSFNGCLKISENLSSLPFDAFYNCRCLTGGLLIPHGVTSIGGSAFAGCSGLAGNLSIPDSITKLVSGVFEGCSGFTGSLSIPFNVTSIEEDAFSGCIGFTGSLAIPDSVTSIGKNAFSGCTGFTGSLAIPDSVTSIEDGAFSGCNKIDTVIIGKGIVSIGTEYDNCTSLAQIVIPASVKNMIFAFGNISKNCIIYGTAGSYAETYAAEHKFTFKNLDDFDGGNPYQFRPGSLSDSQYSGFGYVTDNPADSLTVNGATYKVGSTVVMTPGLYLHQYVLYRLDESNNINGICTAPCARGTLQRYNSADNSVTIDGVKYFVNSLTDSSTISKITANAGKKVKFYYNVGGFNSKTGLVDPLQLYRINSCDTITGKMTSLDVLGTEPDAYIDGKAYGVSNDEKLLSDLQKAQFTDVICELEDGKITSVFQLGQIWEGLSCSVDVSPQSIKYQNGSFSSDTAICKVTVKNAVSSAFGGDVSALKDNSAFDVTVAGGSIKSGNMNICGFQGAETTSLPVSGTVTLHAGESITYQVSITLKSGYKPSTDTESADITCTVNGTQNGTDKTCSGSGSLKITRASSAGDDYEPTSENISYAQRASDAIHSVSTSGWLFTKDTVEWGWVLESYLQPDQLSMLTDTFLCELALQGAEEETYRNALKEKTGANLAETLMDKVLGDWKPKVGAGSINSVCKVRIETKKYGYITVNISCDGMAYSFNGDYFGKLCTIKYTIVQDKADAKKNKYPYQSGSGSYVDVNPEKFFSQVQNVALSEIKSAYNTAWGSNANLVANQIFGQTVMDILKCTKYKNPSGLMFQVITYPTMKCVSRCPINVYLYDTDGKLCGAIEDNKVIKTGDFFTLSVDGEAKTVVTDGNYNVQFISTDTGSMEVEISEYAGPGRLIRTLYLDAVPLEVGTSYKEKIGEDCIKNASDYSLTSNKNVVIEPDSVISGGNESGIYASSNVQSLTLSKTSLQIGKGESAVLSASVLPDTAKDHTVFWKSSDESIATVDENGKVSAVSAGTAHVDALCDGITATCNVTVTESTDPGTDPTAKLPFTDVPATKWYYSSVQYVYQKGIITGTGKTTFSPSGNLTRGQFAAILYRMAGRPAVTYTAKYKDVPDGKYYSAAAMWSSSDSVGVLFGDRNSSGQSVGYYRPLDKITRQEMAAAMYRYAKYKGLDSTASSDISGYPDVSSVSSWGVAAMKWAVGNGIITGQKKSGVAYLMPKGNATRAECAAIIKRFCEKFGQ